jgi:hypothetical protein
MEPVQDSSRQGFKRKNFFEHLKYIAYGLLLRFGEEPIKKICLEKGVKESSFKKLGVLFEELAALRQQTPP